MNQAEVKISGLEDKAKVLKRNKQRKWKIMKAQDRIIKEMWDTIKGAIVRRGKRIPRQWL